MRVLVTGGSGFVGSALIRNLLHDSVHEVINVDLNQRKGLEFVGKNTRYFYVKADVTNQEAMDAIFEKFRPQSVFHLAERNVHDTPRHLLQSNVYGTLVVLEAVKNFACPNPGEFRLIIGSTDDVYERGGAIRETTAFHPSTPFAATKASADWLAMSWHETYQIPVILTHAAEAYGPYQDLQALIPAIVENGCNSKHTRISGDKKRNHDLIHVEDYAKGLRRAMEMGEPGETYNFGGNELWTTEQVVKMVCGHLDCFVPRKAGHQELFEFDEETTFVKRGQIDNKKSIDKLLWLPSTRFMFGVRDTVEWLVKQIFENAGIRLAS